MLLFRCIQRGIRNVRRNLVVVWLPWAITLGFGSLSIWLAPAARLRDFPGNDMTLETALLQAGAWIPFLQLEGFLGYPFASRSHISAGLLGLAFLLLLTFLDAGVIVFLSTPILGHRIRQFFSLGPAYAGRLLRILLIGLVPAASLTGIGTPLQERLLDCGLPIADCRLRGILDFGFSANLALAALFSIQVVAGYARVQAVLEERTSMLLTWLSAVRFACQNWAVVLGIALLQLLGAWMMLALASGRILSPVVSLFGAMASGIILQSLIWLGYFLRAIIYAAAIDLVQASLATQGARLFRKDR